MDRWGTTSESQLVVTNGLQLYCVGPLGAPPAALVLLLLTNFVLYFMLRFQTVTVLLIISVISNSSLLKEEMFSTVLYCFELDKAIWTKVDTSVSFHSFLSVFAVVLHGCPNYLDTYLRKWYLDMLSLHTGYHIPCCGNNSHRRVLKSAEAGCSTNSFWWQCHLY